ncbi:hypothetical protein LIER_18120 [Lithospermum erythrorhizon]|uniref:Uncharacterized protein n=1 Tax=Lithospermum erythrorhizon TaxID=34254 RepID=A0AAV3QH91_LITER
MTTPLTGFIGHSVYPKGIANLDFMVGPGDKKIHDQSIVHYPGYPGFGGRHVPIRKRPGYVIRRRFLLWDKRQERQRSVVENHPEVMIIRGEVQEQNDNSPKERESIRKPVPHEEVVNVPFADHEPEKTFRMRTMLEENQKEGLIQLIREYKDIFAWGPEYMSGIDTSVALH